MSDNNFIKLLNVLDVDDIKSTELLDEFSDDHIPCAYAKINDVDLNLFWCGSTVIGALEFANESSKAKQVVYNALVSSFHMNINIAFDFTNEDLIDEINKNRDKYESILSYIRKKGKDSDIWSEIAGYFEDDKIIDTNTMTLK